MITTIKLEEVENQLTEAWFAFSKYYAEQSEQEPIQQMHNIVSASCEFEYAIGKSGLLSREAVFTCAPPPEESNWNEQQVKYYQSLCAYHEVLDAQQPALKLSEWVDASELSSAE